MFGPKSVRSSTLSRQGQPTSCALLFSSFLQNSSTNAKRLPLSFHQRFLCFGHPSRSIRCRNVLTRINAVRSNGQEDDTHYQKQMSSTKQKQTRMSSSTSKRLQPPEIIFSNNHLLVVNKSPGWKSQPGEGSGSSNSFDTKCLLTYLKKQSLGGGSQKDFLTPTHRLDQPCTGVLIFAKNGKSASRVQVAWSKRQVEKCYWVVVEGGISDGGGKMSGLQLLQHRSGKLSKGAYRLSAVVSNKKSNNGDRSLVIVKPIHPSQLEDTARNDGRICHIEWRHLLRLPDSEFATSRHLLSIKTDTGAKHQVRALLAIAGGAPIAGDLRYGNNISSINKDGGKVHQPLRDQSVALHARSVFLPTVSLGGMEFLKEEPFVADIPKSWRELFGLTENNVTSFRDETTEQ